MSLTTEERQVITEYRTAKALEAIEEAKECRANSRYSLAIQRLYYSAYYAASAVLIKRGLTVHTHAGVHNLLHKELVQTAVLTVDDGRVFGRLMQMRHTGDYDDCFDFTSEDVDLFLPKTEALVKKLLGNLK